MWRGRRELIALAILVGVAPAGCAPKGADQPGAAIVERRALEDVFVLSGELRAVRAEYLTVPPIEQPQIKWLAPDGAPVDEGDLVAEFDDTGLLSRLEELRTTLTQASIARESRVRELSAERQTKQAALAKAEIEVEKARLEADVPRELRSELEWRQFQAALHERRAALEKARLDLEAFEVAAQADLATQEAALNKARRALDSAEEVLSSVSLEAPRAGLFVVEQHRMGQDRKYQPGDNVHQGMPVASIPDPSEMEVAARLPEVDWGRVEPGQPAYVILDTQPELVFEGRIADVTPVASRQGNVSGYPVRVALARTEPAIMRPGLSVRVEVVRARWEAALCLPRAAVRLDAENPRVVSLSGDVLPVELLGCTPTLCAIASGLEEGDRVRRF